MSRNLLLPVLRDLGFEMGLRDEKNWGSSILVPAPGLGGNRGFPHPSGSRIHDLPNLPDRPTAPPIPGTFSLSGQGKGPELSTQTAVEPGEGSRFTTVPIVQLSRGESSQGFDANERCDAREGAIATRRPPVK